MSFLIFDIWIQSLDYNEPFLFRSVLLFQEFLENWALNDVVELPSYLRAVRYVLVTGSETNSTPPF